MPLSPSSSSSSSSSAPAAEGTELAAASSGPFHGLVICVSGLSKVKSYIPAMAQVYDFIVHMHTALVTTVIKLMKSLTGRKFEHALKHGVCRGLFVVSLGWFLDSVKTNGKTSVLSQEL
ncbi:hypothetical protein AKJ16_DCAP12413 [Drosera capensis]